MQPTRLSERNQQAGDAVLDGVDAGRRPRSRRPGVRRPSPRARRRRSPRAATGRTRPPRARSTARAPPAGTKPTASGTRSRSGPSPTITRGRPAGRLDELEDALLLAQPADVEHVRRVGRLADLVGDLDRRSGSRAPRVAPSAAASPARNDDAAITMRARRTSGRTSHGTRRASSTSVPQTWRTNGLPVASAASRGRDPVRVHDVGVARRPPRRPRERGQEERHRGDEPGPRAQVLHDPAAEGDAEVAEVGRRDDRTSTPASRSRATASATNTPATSSAERGYDVVRTRTFTPAATAGRRAAPRARRPGRRRSNRTAS